eukprot:1813100-Rhodomonas_salina.9
MPILNATITCSFKTLTVLPKSNTQYRVSSLIPLKVILSQVLRDVLQTTRQSKSNSKIKH